MKILQAISDWLDKSHKVRLVKKIADLKLDIVEIHERCHITETLYEGKQVWRSDIQKYTADRAILARYKAELIRLEDELSNLSK